MASLSTLCVLLLLSSMHEIQATTVEVTVPMQPVTVGGVLAIQCKIWNMETDHQIRMYRVTKTHTEQLTLGLMYVESSLGQRMFLAVRNTPGGVPVYFTTIVDVSLLDQGEYFCKVYTLSGSDHIKVTEGSTNVEVYFLPNSIYPQCQSTPAVVENMDENVQLRLKCLSAEGAPAVDLRWIDHSNEEIFSRSITQDNTVSAEIILLTLASHHDGKIFICEMTSPGFTDFKRTCQIGPITIKPNIKLENTVVMKPNLLVPPTQSTEHTSGILSNDCNSKCLDDDKYTILYLSVATIGATMLTLVFLITTIIMCFKYYNASNGVTNTQRNITSYDGSEPVYVSLQRRLEPERSSLYREPDRSSIYKEPERRSVYKESDRRSTYMSVEDPNNPGSKVLMPKEVFEEFYNSLSLKRV